MPAILKRPDSFGTELSRPSQRRIEARLADSDSAISRAARRFLKQLQPACATPCAGQHRARSSLSPSPLLRVDGPPADAPCLGPKPRSYQVTPDVPDQRRATQRKPVRPNGRQAERESAHRRPEPHFEAGRHSPNQNSKAESAPRSAALERLIRRGVHFHRLTCGRRCRTEMPSRNLSRSGLKVLLGGLILKALLGLLVERTFRVKLRSRLVGAQLPVPPQGGEVSALKSPLRKGRHGSAALQGLVLTTMGVGLAVLLLGSSPAPSRLDRPSIAFIAPDPGLPGRSFFASTLVRPDACGQRTKVSLAVAGSAEYWADHSEPSVKPRFEFRLPISVRNVSVELRPVESFLDLPDPYLKARDPDRLRFSVDQSASAGGERFVRVRGAVTKWSNQERRHRDLLRRRLDQPSFRRNLLSPAPRAVRNIQRSQPHRISRRRSPPARSIAHFSCCREGGPFALCHFPGSPVGEHVSAAKTVVQSFVGAG